jgi:putative FmdB family regulatory protein
MLTPHTGQDLVPGGFSMPIYEYLCQVCGHALEALQKLSDPVLVACPACARPALKKQVSAAGFQLKGSGWYATDFKNNGTKDNDNKDKDKQKEPASTEAKSESTPASASPGGSTSGTGGHGGGACGCH